MVGLRGVILLYILVSFFPFFFLLCLMSLDTPDSTGYLRVSLFSPTRYTRPILTWMKIWAICRPSCSVQYKYY